nr:odorant receptor 85c-like [Nomia melanderi]
MKCFFCQYRYCGLWCIHPKTASILQCGYFIWKISIFAILYVFAITLFAYVCSNIDNMSAATDSGCICAGMAVVIFKAMIYQFNREFIKRLIIEVLKCADDLVEDIVKRHYLFNRTIVYGFNLLGSGLVIALLLFSPMEDGLPIRAKYPFNTTIPPWHAIALTIEVVAVSGGVLAILSVESITLLISNLITMQFDVLNVNFENCGRQAVNDTNRVYKERSIEREPSYTFLSRYKTCLRFHQRLMSMASDYNKIYSLSVLFQMCSSTSIICLTGFQAVVVGGQNSDIIKFGVYLSAAISQLFYICWVGNELTYSCSVLDRSQWLSNWHQENFRDIVQVFTSSTMFVRHSIYLKAGPFYVLSLQTFMAQANGEPKG